MTQIANSILDRVEQDDTAVGLIVRTVKSGEIAMIAKVCDFDFVFIDAQHAAFSVDVAAEIIEACVNAGIASLVRTLGSHDPNIPLYLDAGASGLIIPDVATRAQAEKAVRAAKFPPLGRRSLPGLIRLLNYQTLPQRKTMDLCNERTLLICMIESREGVKNADEILAVEGVDGVHLGCVDLLSDLGVGYSMEKPEFIQMVESVIGAACRQGKLAGLGGDRDNARVAAYIEKGARLVTAQLDTALLMSAAQARVSEIRNLTKAN
tara:strand:- start:5553 stop:6344 length:792 start_codon:yes stop_codon:yes gene_type:complete